MNGWVNDWKVGWIEEWTDGSKLYFFGTLSEFVVVFILMDKLALNFLSAKLTTIPLGSAGECLGTESVDRAGWK